MSGNIVSAIAQLLTSDVMDKMAATAELDRGTAKKVVDVGVPAILGGLTDLLSKPQGAQRLACAVVKQAIGPWEGLTSVAGAPAQVAQAGGNLLTSLLGSGSVGALTSSISRYIGTPESSTRAFLSLLMPAIVSALGQERRNAGVDAMGIVDILKSQKDLIGAAMPAGLTSLLQSTGYYDRLGVSPPPSHRTTADPSRATTRDVSAPTWAYWALPLLVLAGLGWYFLGDRVDRKVVSEHTNIATSTPQIAGGIRDGTTYLAAAPGDSVSIGAFHGRDVYNRAGERIGTVTDLVVGSDGRIAAAVISVGRFLGIGEKSVAIPFSILQPSQRQDEVHLVVDAVRDQLRAAPAFEQVREHLRSGAPNLEDPATTMTPPAAGAPAGSTVTPKR